MQTLLATAKHLRVELDANIGSELAKVVVRDGPSLQAAFSNLVLNAMHEGSRVSVACTLLAGQFPISERPQSMRGEGKSYSPASSESDRIKAEASGTRVGAREDNLTSAAGTTPANKQEHRVGYALLTVCDNGNGPPPEVAHEIFEPFVTSKPEGLGLGLPLVARCARRLEGEVQWDRVGQQTQFSLRFKVLIPVDVSVQDFSENR